MRGGGLHGHLAMVMSDANYLAPAGVAFAIHVYPGPLPPPVGAAAAMAIATLLYTEAIADVTLYNNLSTALTAQILTAVNASFPCALEDPTFGFSDVTPRTMLNHLRTEYGTLTPEELETNWLLRLIRTVELRHTHRRSLGKNRKHPTRCRVR
jgi:hypothetical protein